MVVRFPQWVAYAGLIALALALLVLLVYATTVIVARRNKRIRTEAEVDVRSRFQSQQSQQPQQSDQPQQSHQPHTHRVVTHHARTASPEGTVYVRDRRVLDDPLYPPLNRQDADQASLTGPRLAEDRFRLLGYLRSSPDETERDASGNNAWKLMGRTKDRHGQAEFYIVPTNTNDDIKLPVTNEMMAPGSERLRDLYTLPPSMRFDSHFLNKSEYTFTELPRTDLQSHVYV